MHHPGLTCSRLTGQARRAAPRLEDNGCPYTAAYWARLLAARAPHRYPPKKLFKLSTQTGECQALANAGNGSRAAAYRCSHLRFSTMS